MDRDSTIKLRPDQLARLLTVLCEPEPEVWLARSLAGPVGLGEARPGRRLGEVLLDPRTNLGLLRTIKDHWKAVSLRVPDGAEHAGAIALYYAAIAAALVHHGTLITKNSPAELSEALATLVAKPWLPRDLRGLMESASRPA